MIKLFSRTKEVTLICSSILLLAFFGMYNTKLAGMLGISFYTAKRIVDIISTASWYRRGWYRYIIYCQSSFKEIQ